MKQFEESFSQMASLLGDRTRSLILCTLLEGRAYTATELSLRADISPQSASNHLSKLVDAGILAVRNQGRHRYYSLASPEAAQALESIAALLPPWNLKSESMLPAGIAYARSCYDHLAGRLGVEMTDSLLGKSILADSNGEFVVTPAGEDWLSSLGLDITEMRRQKRAFARKCLDWSERRHHLAGALGASIFRMMLTNNWVRRRTDSRELVVTPTGRIKLGTHFNLDL